MILLQVIVAVGVLFAISRVFLLFRKRQISVRMALFWSVLWLAVLVVFFVPGVVSLFSDFFGVQRGADLLVFGSVLALFYLVFRTNAKVDNVERQITELVRRDALKNEKK